MTGRLSGKVAVVTGASRGLGHAISRLYGREGARVVIASRSATAVADAVEALRREGMSTPWRVRRRSSHGCL